MKVFINGQLHNVSNTILEDKSEWLPCNSSQSQRALEDGVSRRKRRIELEKHCRFAVLSQERAFIRAPKDKTIDENPAYAPFNPENLKIWYEAANLGISNGCYLLGQCLIGMGEIKEGLQWLKTAIAQGHKQAKRALGECLLDSGRRDEGLKLLKEAANSGDAYACDALAMRYQEGEGAPKSRSKYRFYLKRAARLGSRFARHCLDAENFLSGWRW